MAEFTYNDNAIREDLADIITNLNPTDYQLYTGLGKTSAKSTLHEWLTDTYKTVGTNAQVEGFTPSYAARTRPARVRNHTQIISVDVEVTDTERAVDQAGFADRYSYELDKAMVEWKNDAEYALMRGASDVTGTGSAARYMVGIKGAITTVVTNPSGVSLSENMFNDYLNNVWNTSKEVIDEVYVGGPLKRRISGFTAGSTKNVDAEDKRLTNSVNVYESDFGIVKVFLHRHVSISGTDTNNDMVGIKNDLFKVAHLEGRTPKHVPLAKVGSTTRGMVEGELTLEYRNQLGAFKTTGLL